MSAPPPPPPPAFNIGSAATSPGDSGRNMLLQSIRSGKQLKKTVTVDKSAPCIAGTVKNGSTNGNNSISSPPSSRNTSNNTTNNRSSSGGGGGPMSLGGLFAGGMPKLKPTGLRGGIVDKDNSPSPPSPSNSTPNHTPSHTTGTIKRGPPPVPPPAAQKPQVSSQNTNEINSNEVSKGFGKPMLAPKPPAPSPTPVSPSPPQKPYPPPKKLDLMRSGSVSRAQSMRLPRSPPVLAPSPSSLYQSQDCLNETQHRSINRILKPPVVRPPSPPTSRSTLSLNPSATRAAPPPPNRVAVPTMPPPPPPPPHRLNTSHQRHAPPPPPTRNLSLSNDQSINNTINQSTNNNTIDLEQRFIDFFHSIASFPNPEPFRGVPKLYNSKNAAKQQAPAPPPPPSHSNASSGSMIQLNASSGVKQWQHNAASSAC